MDQTRDVAAPPRPHPAGDHLHQVGLRQDRRLRRHRRRHRRQGDCRCRRWRRRSRSPIELGGGLLLLVGWKARWAALLIFLWLIPTTLLFHNFWAVPPEQYMNQQNHFLKNVAIMGGMLMVWAFGPGRFGDGARRFVEPVTRLTMAICMRRWRIRTSPMDGANMKEKKITRAADRHRHRRQGPAEDRGGLVAPARRQLTRCISRRTTSTGT